MIIECSCVFFFTVSYYFAIDAAICRLLSPCYACLTNVVDVVFVSSSSVFVRLMFSWNPTRNLMFLWNPTRNLMFPWTLSEIWCSHGTPPEIWCSHEPYQKSDVPMKPHQKSDVPMNPIRNLMFSWNPTRNLMFPWTLSEIWCSHGTPPEIWCSHETPSEIWCSHGTPPEILCSQKPHQKSDVPMKPHQKSDVPMKPHQKSDVLKTPSEIWCSQKPCQKSDDSENLSSDLFMYYPKTPLENWCPQKSEDCSQGLVRSKMGECFSSAFLREEFVYGNAQRWRFRFHRWHVIPVFWQILALKCWHYIIENPANNTKHSRTKTSNLKSTISLECVYQSNFKWDRYNLITSFK